MMDTQYITVVVRFATRYGASAYSFACGCSFLSMASATRRLWILPVAVLGMISVKKICDLLDPAVKH